MYVLSDDDYNCDDDDHINGNDNELSVVIMLMAVMMTMIGDGYFTQC